MVTELLPKALIDRLVEGSLVDQDYVDLDGLVNWLLEGADQRYGLDPRAEPLYEVCLTLSDMLERPIVTPEDGKALLDALATAVTLDSAEAAA